MKEGEALDFPCEYPVKVMGLNTKKFIKEIILIIEKHTGEIPESSISYKISKNAKYISLTVLVNAPARSFLEDIYLDLRASKSVLVLL